MSSTSVLHLKSQTLSIPSTTNGRISNYGGGNRLSSVGSQRKDWRSGHKLVDNLIQGIRLDFPFPSHHLSWIPFDEFVGLKFVSRGGFSAIYESMWTNTGQTVALKCLDGSQDFSTDFLDEIKSHWCLFSQPQFLRCHGITQLPNSREFMMVMQYALFGDLRSHLQRTHICNSKRPPIPIGTPEFYSKLMNSCWDTNPNKRPDAHDVLKTVYHWLVNDSLDDHLRKAGGSTISSFSNTGNDRTNPEAIYYSRLLEFPELKNTKLQQHQSLRQSFLGILDQHTDLNRPLSSVYSFTSTRIDNNNNKDDIYSKLESSNNKRTSVVLPDDDLTTLQTFWAMDSQNSKNKKEPISSAS
ncbi:14803_t:CDS:2 [Entrophospora sp. SA101]|nr:14803_t:CDS:2 [Entrophospora sp. SA101]